MEVKLLRADVEDAKELHEMQIKSFRELLEKYQDFDTSPANEGMEKVEARVTIQVETRIYCVFRKKK